ncbi:MAG: DUF4359 domain-containing protein, partial [Nitrospirales bacterium]
MKLLVFIACVLGIAVALSMTNPTAQEYEQYEDQLFDQVVNQIYASPPGKEGMILRQLTSTKGGLFMKTLARSQTVHRNFVLFSMFETKLLAAEIKVLGIAGEFHPITDVKEIVKQLEKSVIAGGR